MNKTITRIAGRKALFSVFPSFIRIDCVPGSLHKDRESLAEQTQWTERDQAVLFHCAYSVVGTCKLQARKTNFISCSFLCYNINCIGL